MNLAAFENMALKLAIIAFPSDGGKGGGLSLLAGMVPHVARRGGRVMWIDELYDSDHERVALLVACETRATNSGSSQIVC